MLRFKLIHADKRGQWKSHLSKSKLNNIPVSLVCQLSWFLCEVSRPGQCFKASAKILLPCLCSETKEDSRWDPCFLFWSCVESSTHRFNPSGAIWRKKSCPPFILVLSWCLFCAKTILEPMLAYCHLHPNNTFKWHFIRKLNNFIHGNATKSCNYF